MAMLQALKVIPLPKREAPLVIDLEDEDTQPPPKRRKTTDKEGQVQSMQVKYVETSPQHGHPLICLIGTG